MRIAYLPIALALAVNMSCSSGGQPKRSISFDETPLSDNSSTMTIKSDISRWSAVEGSFSVMCTVARLTMNRGFKYFYIDERRKPANGLPSFRVTFYKSPPEGIPVINPMDARDPREAPDPMTSVMDAKAWVKPCNLYESQRMPDGATGTPVSAMDTATPAGATGIPVSEMDYVLKFRGFSIQQPTDDRWHLHSDNQDPHIASFYFVPLSPTHSFNATVQIRGLPADFATKQEFKAFVDTKLREHSSRFEELSFISTLTELSGEWAVTYELRYLDKNPVNSSTPLFMTIKGFMYLHPYWKKRVIDAFYSERGTEAELDGTLDPVGQELIDGTSPEMS